MAIGDSSNIQQRLRSLIPPGWIPDVSDSPVATGGLAGASSAFAFIWNLFQYVIQQTRIATATGGWLDLIAWDYFGGRFLRRASEGDALFRPRILQEVLRPRQTRVAIIRMLQDLTGRTPILQEPPSTFDFGSYHTGTMGYGAGLGYGSISLPNQIFVTAFRPTTSGVANVGGYGGYLGGYGVGSLEYIDQSLVTGPLLDSEIYARIAQVIAAGVTAWVDITSGIIVAPAPVIGRSLDFRLPTPDSEYVPLI
jgi:hypothetical protein